MNADEQTAYQDIRGGRAGFYEKRRGLIAVRGGEAVQFLDGMITNNVKKLSDGEQMLAAFPNAQGRLIAVVRVTKQGGHFYFETEEATRETVYQHLFRFTYAGDFFVEDISPVFSAFEIFGPKQDVYHPNVAERMPGTAVYELPHGALYFVPSEKAGEFRSFLADENRCLVISDELYEVLRIEAGIPLYGKDMDDNTIVPELGLDGLISYDKGCYVGQEIIARIHFRGHVAKRLTGLVLSGPREGDTVELRSMDDKDAGRITSVTFSPSLGKDVALGYVRFEHLTVGTQLRSGDIGVTVDTLPLVPHPLQENRTEGVP
jgi:aminomethyltransferase